MLSIYILAIWCEKLTHSKRPWWWERLKAGGEGDDRGWDGWMASPTQWTWVWVNCRSWWWTGRPGVLWFMGSQRVGQDWATELNWFMSIKSRLFLINMNNSYAYCIQFSSVTQLCPALLCVCVQLFTTPWTTARQVSLSITNSRRSLKLSSIESVIPSNHLILCRPLLLLPSILPSIRVFSNESALRIRWPKYWSFSFSISPSNEHAGLISFRMDWLDLLAVQGTLKSLLQHHSSKYQFFSAHLSLWFYSHIHTWPLEKP